ncbi:hypothetical protein K8I28_04360 [bacterium]|nr:hypothetical protein [bacterium]
MNYWKQVLSAALLSTILLLFSATTPALSQDNFNISKVSSLYDFWMGAFAVVVDGDDAWIATGGSGLRLLDVSDRENPVEVLTLAEARGETMVRQGNYLYCGKHIVDISDRNAPQLVGSVPITNIIVENEIAGNFLYLLTKSLSLNYFSPAYECECEVQQSQM